MSRIVHLLFEMTSSFQWFAFAAASAAGNHWSTWLSPYSAIVVSEVRSPYSHVGLVSSKKPTRQPSAQGNGRSSCWSLIAGSMFSGSNSLAAEAAINGCSSLATFCCSNSSGSGGVVVVVVASASVVAGASMEVAGAVVGATVGAT